MGNMNNEKAQAQAAKGAPADKGGTAPGGIHVKEIFEEILENLLEGEKLRRTKIERLIHEIDEMEVDLKDLKTELAFTTLEQYDLKSDIEYLKYRRLPGAVIEDFRISKLGIDVGCGK